MIGPLPFRIIAVQKKYVRLTILVRMVCQIRVQAAVGTGLLVQIVTILRDRNEVGSIMLVDYDSLWNSRM